jgi:ankyrin repeat protein
MSIKSKFSKAASFYAVFFFIIISCGFAQEKKYAADAVNQAAYVGDIALIREILKTNPDRDARDSFGGAALHDAMFQKNIDIVILLIENGYDINAIGPANGYTPLHDAVMANNAEAAKVLLKYGARRDIKGKDGLTPLEKAKKENKTELIKILSR